MSDFHLHHQPDHHHEAHFKSSDLVRDVVIGMADGLTVPFALAAGLTGAVLSNNIIVAAGVAEIAAGSIAMGLGGYLAGKTEQEHYDSELRRERFEVEKFPEKEKAERLCRKYGIQDKVIFFGNSNEIDRILCLTDLFLLPSETESFGLAALEAMACGVPVISSNSGGLPEVNFDGVSGYLSNVGDINEMAKNALKILKDDTILAEFKLNAITVAKKFDIVNILPLYEALYLKAINKYK